MVLYGAAGERYPTESAGGAPRSCGKVVVGLPRIGLGRMLAGVDLVWGVDIGRIWGVGPPRMAPGGALALRMIGLSRLRLRRSATLGRHSEKSTAQRTTTPHTQERQCGAARRGEAWGGAG
ncbi:hypothetical protein GCM10009745_84290 [Kribbella yunnanensis]|uniref:Uncharacterized protein n=1 Tax=Kribbella yunnanensis TaxID=190194 RepID=A0ABP4VGV8_9ACTN